MYYSLVWPPLTEEKPAEALGASPAQEGLRLASGTSQIPHPRKAASGGEDPERGAFGFGMPRPIARGRE
eukprot:795798-Alexandrium_andersonii.AAC.1